ncbi:MAG: alpha/beta hydrolase, partial [Rhodococcus fascians]
AAKCVERTGADVLEHVGTREVVQDMDVIRSVLGDEKLTYLGYSYGTRIGAAYAEAFPDRVRAMVLDGALDPEQSPVDEAVEQGAAFQGAFEAFAEDCAQSEACPLGPDPAAADRTFRELVDPLIQTPAATTDPRGLGYDDAITGTQQALYSQSLWRILRVGLTELQEGRGDTLLRLADTYSGRLDDGTYSNLDDAFNAIRCVDDPPTTDRAEAGEADRRYREAAPFLDDGRGTGNAPLDVCAFWPVPNTSTPYTISAEGLPKLVVISTTFDPATPYQAGVELARQLDADLITFDGAQHTVAFSGENCVDEPVVDYLVDLTPPGNDLVC